MRYLDTINDKIKDYFKVLEPMYPEWLDAYINTKELLQQQYISVTCGAIYTDLFDIDFFYSSLDHSIAVALIIWHFTHDKKQTLAGLFHDIATPTFKHCIDFLNKDYMKQESTEDLTLEILKNSPEITNLLKKDNILLEEVYDYHMYPIADNDTPKLSADRLEYSLANAYITYKIVDNLETIKEFYQDIIVSKNEDGIPELAFKSKDIAKRFVFMTSKLSIIYREEKTIYSMQLIADIIKRLNHEGIIKEEDLYHLREEEVINIIKNSKYKDIFNKWRNAKNIIISFKDNPLYYTVRQKTKIRYIDPLVKNERISKICIEAKNEINDNLNAQVYNYAYLKEIKKF